MQPIELSEEETQALAHILKTSQKPMVATNRDALLTEVQRKCIGKEFLAILEKILEETLSSELVEVRDREIARNAFKLYKRTPVGEEAERLLVSTNRALSRLKGTRVERISCSNARFGVQRVEIETDRYTMVLEAQGNTIRLTEVEL